MTSDTRPSRAADPAPPALRAAIREGLLIADGAMGYLDAGVDCLTTNTFGANLGNLGVTLSEEFQLHPEQSTSAVVVLNPHAKYFSV